MKKIMFFPMAAAIMALTASCLDDQESYSAGFDFYNPQVTMLYANTPSDTIIMVSGGDWTASSSSASGGSWCTMNMTSGRANTFYAIPLTFKQNTTGESRYTMISFVDVAHPNDGHANIYYWQYATRGDGTLGNAPDVKTITASDGSRYEFTYDALHRPLSLRINSDEGGLLRELKLSYYDRDSMIIVTDGSKTLQGTFSKDYQPSRLIGSGDTVGYFPQYYINGMPMSTNYAFNLEHRTTIGQNTCSAFLVGGQSLSPDSLHCADSLRIATYLGQGATDLGSPSDTKVSMLKLHYSKNDNRRQSVDVNQLAIAAATGLPCDPYQLLSLFRYARQTSIVSQITTDDPTRTATLTTTLNPDGSVRTMTVNCRDTETTYTFEY